MPVYAMKNVFPESDSNNLTPVYNSIYNFSRTIFKFPTNSHLYIYTIVFSTGIHMYIFVPNIGQNCLAKV